MQPTIRITTTALAQLNAKIAGHQQMHGATAAAHADRLREAIRLGRVVPVENLLPDPRNGDVVMVLLDLEAADGGALAAVVRPDLGERAKDGDLVCVAVRRSRSVLRPTPDEVATNKAKATQTLLEAGARELPKPCEQCGQPLAPRPPKHRYKGPKRFCGPKCWLSWKGKHQPAPANTPKKVAPATKQQVDDAAQVDERVLAHLQEYPPNTWSAYRTSMGIRGDRADASRDRLLAAGKIGYESREVNGRRKRVVVVTAPAPAVPQAPAASPLARILELTPTLTREERATVRTRLDELDAVPPDNRGALALRIALATRRQDALHVAREIGVSGDTVARWCNGTEVPGKIVAGMLESRYGVDVSAWEDAVAAAPAPKAGEDPYAARIQAWITASPVPRASFTTAEAAIGALGVEVRDLPRYEQQVARSLRALGYAKRRAGTPTGGGARRVLWSKRTA